MNRTIFFVVMVVGIVAGVYVFQMPGPVADRSIKAASIKGTGAEPSQIANNSSSKALSDSASDREIELSADSVAELQAALDVAVKDREKAEQAMRVIEMKLSALEAQLDDIELRGDNPADVQDETLATFQAIFAEYQDTILLYEKAVSKEQWIGAKIDAAGL